ncbi:hypothetical protein KEU06_05050 [Pseudaminobacter sp. 19-2017]|uniref:Uncharacterized protein n=1 Tax=Pseudaminobacter soli (ex Zhang et al. 2022) TaxID=2831468 RepID=A0A942E3T9_9HYPH|nr:hypothetical protein [Pseudaminobacter soli]MBS3647997.1 hypothetical protein [Pseudaminobacter soli]
MAASNRRAAKQPGDVIDAEFETVGPQAQKAGRIDPREVGLNGLTCRVPTSTRLFDRRGGVAFWLTGMTLVASAFWISGGHTLARNFLPGGETAAPTISGLTARIDASGARHLLLVDGTASNEGTRQVKLPFLTISVSARDGSVTRYKLGTSSPSLASGERFAFSSRLDVPRSGVKSVAVSFAE